MANHTKKWVDALEDVVYAYNRSKHTYHKQRPKDVAKNPFTQLLQRIKTIQSNLNLKSKKDFILNRIKAKLSGAPRLFKANFCVLEGYVLLRF